MDDPEYHRLRSEAYKLVRFAETKHDDHTLTGVERSYWQGCKDGTRRMFALIFNDPEMIAIIRSSSWHANHDSILDDEPGEVVNNDSNT